MAGFKFWFCLILIALSFSSTRARASVHDPHADMDSALIRSAKEMFKASLKRQEEYHYDINREESLAILVAVNIEIACFLQFMPFLCRIFVPSFIAKFKASTKDSTFGEQVYPNSSLGIIVPVILGKFGVKIGFPQCIDSINLQKNLISSKVEALLLEALEQLTNSDHSPQNTHEVRLHAYPMKPPIRRCNENINLVSSSSKSSRALYKVEVWRSLPPGAVQPQ
ncbi:unnamed protein product [Fraxinus pennsylvanica]|uniref:Uncharacterized protein n=1 Tax=Fraxinus pennsylvanica TaxID=56036 RepID=A0AAD2DMX2_9LAMI|nr:unnamed protein product [Fraxinus pennsylvanica]